MNFNYAKDSKEQRPYEHYFNLYQTLDPQQISERTGIPFDADKKVFELRLMGSTYQISHPDYNIQHVADSIGYYPLEEAMNAKILILRYFVEGNAAPSAGEFVTYREVPWGEVYFRNFQGRCLSRLAFGFGNRLEKFQSVMDLLGASKTEFGDSSYEFEFINNLYLRFILWEGDDEFPPSSQILFSDNFSLAYSAEDLAVVGDVSIGLMKTLEKQLG